MKKKIVYGISVLAIAAVAAWNVGLNLNSPNSHNLSDIQLANVEALADSEGTANGNPYYCCGSSGICYVIVYEQNFYGPTLYVSGTFRVAPC
jgi:hypothetical protein